MIDYAEIYTGKRREAQYGSLGSVMTEFAVIPSLTIPLALRYPDEFGCSARGERIGKSSASYAYEIQNLAGEVAIAGRIVLVVTVLVGNKLELPSEFRIALERAL